MHDIACRVHARHFLRHIRSFEDTRKNLASVLYSYYVLDYVFKRENTALTEYF